MELIGHFVASPAVLVLVLVVLVLEALLLCELARRRGHSVSAASRSPLRGTLANLGAGACLVLAMLASTLEAHWGWKALGLTGAFVAHLIDLVDRWRA